MPLSTPGVLSPPAPTASRRTGHPTPIWVRQAPAGRCGKPLPPPAVPADVESEAHFDTLLTSTALPLVADFWAPWCGPCHTVAPVLERIAADHAGAFLVVKINTEALPSLAARFHVQSIPTLAVFHHGRELSRSLGAQPASAITAFINAALQKSSV